MQKNSPISNALIKNRSTSLINRAVKSTPFFKPCVQPKLTINQPNDVYEQEADAVAEKVMQMNSNDSVQGKFISPSITTIQRKCAHCEEEERKMQPKELNDEETTVGIDLEKYVDNLGSKGQSLPGEVRDFYEPRLGHDFSNVKIHTDNVAAKSAQSINALAYTSGKNIVFNSGQYSPTTSNGKKLLSHELTHVVQQSSSIQPARIQRMSLGTGTPTRQWLLNKNGRPVPADELVRVREAISIVRNIVNNPDEFDDCISAFNSHCTGNSPTAFADTFNRSILWRYDEEGENGATLVGDNEIGYTRTGYNQGAPGLAQTLVHEMGHNCGIDEPHYLAEVSANYCVGSLNEFGGRIGIGLNSDIYGVALVYRRFFNLARGGQLQAMLGADLDLFGTIMGITSAATGGARTPQFEFGSLSAGLRQRLNLWGGEGFGGITLGQELGVDVGRFRVRRPSGPEQLEYGPGVIFQTTIGAEFYIPINPGIIPLSVDVGYRLIRPLNPQAETLHQVMFGIGLRFE